MILGTTRLYAIIGDPIEHVRTPMAFNAHFEAHGIDAVCLPIHVGRDDLDRGWAGLNAIRNLDGFIVTSPHKAGALRLADAAAGDAALAGAVNTVRREPDGRYTGTLLDGLGFVAGLRRHGHEPAGRSVYISGAGGAGNAVAFALARAGAAAITVHNRTRSKAGDLAARLASAWPDCRVALGTADPSGHDMAVNATSLGLQPGDALSFDLDAASPGTLVAEVVMKPDTTALLERAAARGHPVHRGIHMLEGQLSEMMAFFGLPRP